MYMLSCCFLCLFLCVKYIVLVYSFVLSVMLQNELINSVVNDTCLSLFFSRQTASGAEAADRAQCAAAD